MTAAETAPVGLAGDALPRLLAGLGPDGPVDLAAHVGRHGPLPLRAHPGTELVDLVARAGLTGRGGAGFPTAVKMRATRAAGRGAVVVGNGCEGEPASRKDRLLLTALPHLVLDGLALAAAAVGADRAYLVVPEEPEPWAAVQRAVADRQRARVDQVAVDLRSAPHGYTASQDSALCRWLSGGPARPTFTPPYPAARGVHRRPTLVQNVETLANLALLARYGADWYRQLGTRHAPGTALVTVSGAVARPGVYEVAMGTPLAEVLGRAGAALDRLAGLLVGGYLGGWVSTETAARAGYTPADLTAAGAALGPGVLVALPTDACGLAETARVLRYMAANTAGQCGPCINGLPTLADAFAQLAWQGRDGRVPARVAQLGALVSGRGACHHPDGTSLLAGSALQVFADDVRRHQTRGPCPAAHRPHLLPVPTERR